MVAARRSAAKVCTVQLFVFWIFRLHVGKRRSKEENAIVSKELFLSITKRCGEKKGMGGSSCTATV